MLLGAHRLHGGRRGAARGRRADGRGSRGELGGGSEAAAPLPPLRRPSACQRWRGSAAIWRRAALAHATLANACDLCTFIEFLTLMVCVNVTVYAPTKVSVCINSPHVGVLQVCSARGAAVASGGWHGVENPELRTYEG